MSRVFNMPRRLTDQRRFSKESKLALAAWLGIKFAFGNSTLYDMSIDNFQKFFHIRRSKAKELKRLMWEDSELFYMNENKNCVFAKSCRDKTIKISRRGDRYCNDDVMTIPVPEVYLKSKEEKEFMPLGELVRLLERVLVCKEYDDQTGYKYLAGDQNGCADDCVTVVRKTQLYVSRRTGLSRAKVGRILHEYVSQGIMSKTPACVVRSHKGERYAFKALNKKTHIEYWAKCEPVTFSWINEMPFKFSNLIWNAKKRTRSKFTKSEKRIKKEIAAQTTATLSQEELDYQARLARYFEIRDLYD